ncbi:MAG: SDR family NAD(P)-dependent oxidoreductase [Lachnospiraceae bacterium]
MKKRIIIITGASSGMGREFVRQLSRCTKTIDEIWLIARRQEKLLSLKKELGDIGVQTLPLDLCKEQDLDILEKRLSAEQPSVRILVNAAGVGRAGCFDEITRKEAVNMVDLNDRALVAVTHMVLPYMSRPSNIIQMASASAFLPQKEFAVYAASKAFVLSFSNALQAEVKGRNITVTAVCPGPVDTEFLAISNAGKEAKPLKKLVTVKPGPVVAKALRDAKDGKERSIYGLPMKAVYAASKLLPHGLFLH